MSCVNRRIPMELTGRRRGHRAWRDAIATFATEINFDQATRRNAKWFLSTWVEVNQNVQYGQPVVRTTRVSVSAVIADLRVGTPAQVADWLGLKPVEVTGPKRHDPCRSSGRRVSSPTRRGVRSRSQDRHRNRWLKFAWRCAVTGPKWHRSGPPRFVDQAGECADRCVGRCRRESGPYRVGREAR